MEPADDLELRVSAALREQANVVGDGPPLDDGARDRIGRSRRRRRAAVVGSLAAVAAVLLGVVPVARSPPNPRVTTTPTAAGECGDLSVPELVRTSTFDAVIGAPPRPATAEAVRTTVGAVFGLPGAPA